MKNGIFDFVLAKLDPKSPLRSDRMMGFYLTTIMVIATAAGYDWSSAQDMRAANYINELFTGMSGMVTSFSALLMLFGQFRSRISARDF